MINRLTNVPKKMADVMATASERCSSDPKSDDRKKGIIPVMVVSEVIMMARRRRCPASCTATVRFIPSARNVFMASIFSIESFTTMPQEAMMPMADIMLSE